jgi:hypothetical protein
VLEYTLTTDDLVAYAAWRARESGADDQQGRRFRLAGAWIAGGIAYLAVFAISTLPLLLAVQLPLAGVTEVLDIAVGAAVGWWEWRRGRLGGWLLLRRYRTKARVSLETAGSTRRLGLDADGLTVAAGDRVAHVPWARITGVAETGDQLFILTGGGAHVVPKRVGPGAVEDLASGIRAHIVGG